MGENPGFGMMGVTLGLFVVLFVVVVSVLVSEEGTAEALPKPSTIEEAGAGEGRNRLALVVLH